jgi:hypothetical protein
MLSKTIVLDTINKLPNSFSLDEIVEELILLNKIQTGMEQSKNNEVITHDEMKNKLEKWFK